MYFQNGVQNRNLLVHKASLTSLVLHPFPLPPPPLDLAPPGETRWETFGVDLLVACHMHLK